METDWKTKLLALNVNTIVMGDMQQHRLTAAKKFKSYMSTKGNIIDIVSPDYIFKEHYKPEVYKAFLQSDIAREIKESSIPSAHLIWMLDTMKKLTVEERRQFLKTLSSSGNKFDMRNASKYRFTPSVVVSLLLNDKTWKQNYNALRDFVYPKNRNNNTQVQQ